MTRHDELRAELRELYVRSFRALHPDVIARYESRIALLESDAACILLPGRG